MQTDRHERNHWNATVHMDAVVKTNSLVQKEMTVSETWRESYMAKGRARLLQPLTIHFFPANKRQAAMT
jgi:hypothetical protein